MFRDFQLEASDRPHKNAKRRSTFSVGSHMRARTLSPYREQLKQDASAQKKMLYGLSRLSLTSTFDVLNYTAAPL